MRKAVKSSIVILAILSSFILIAITVTFTSLPHSSGGPDFYATSSEVSLNETITVANKYNLSVYLPSELPNNLERTAIYLRNVSFIAIVVYSAEDNKDYKTAELVIQINPSSSPPTYSDLVALANTNPYRIAVEINSWSVIVNEKASTGGNIETRNKWGAYFLLVTAYIDGMRYMITCPTISTSEAIYMMGTMFLLTG